jgi:hypothetical protein
MDRLSEKIDRDLVDLAFKCHRFVAEGCMNRPVLARRAGLSNTLLAGIERPDFQASLRTLAALEKTIPPGWAPSVPLPNRALGKNLRTFVRRDTGSSSEKLVSRKLYLDVDAAETIDSFGMGRVRAALDQWSDHRGRLREDRVNRTVIKALSGAAVHIIDITEPSPEGFRYEVWDSGTGWKGGTDFTGHRVANTDDPALRDCTFEDFLTVRELGWPGFNAISREFVGAETRRFLRYLYPIEGANQRQKLLCICQPFDFHI